MLDTLKTLTRTRFRKTNFNAFLFFLFFAVIIWLFVQFSKTYSETVEIPVDYINVPPDKVITEDNANYLGLNMRSSGFEIAWFSLSTPTLEIDVAGLEERNGQLLYFIEEHASNIQEQLDIDFDTSEFLSETLTINFYQKAEKKLPVWSNIDTDFAVGFAAAEPIALSPDSVMVSGPEAILDTLNALRTENLILRDIKNNLSGEVAIDTTGLAEVTPYRHKVNYELLVEKFTEGSVTVPVQLINVPEGLNVAIFPKEVVLFYQVNLEDYKKVSAADFRVLADFDELDENQDFLIPKVVQKPSFVNHLRLNEKQIQYIIKK